VKRLLPTVRIKADNCFNTRLALEMAQQGGRCPAAKRCICWQRDDGVAWLCQRCSHSGYQGGRRPAPGRILRREDHRTGHLPRWTDEHDPEIFRQRRERTVKQRLVAN
jgi:hypothetical protein